MSGNEVISGVVGAVLGMLAAQPLRRGWSGLRTRFPGAALRGGPQEEESGSAWTTFSLGPLRTPALIVEGDGEASIPAEAVRVEVLDEAVELPEEMARWRTETEEDAARARAEGRTPPWNGPRYAVASLDVSRTALDERPEVRLRLRPTDYYTFLAAQQLDRRLDDGTTPRSRYLDPDGPLGAPAFLQCSFGVNVAVVTADDQLVVTRRSDRVRMAPGAWNSSVNEGLAGPMDSAGGSAPDLYDVARRGMREELSVEPGEYTLELLAFVLDVGRQQWGAHFCARLTELTRDELRARMSRGVADRWEAQTIDYVPFRPADVIRYLLSPGRVERWAPVAPSLFHLALVRVHGRAPVERAVARIVRSG
ncbi:hypothetical protein [Streptomyces sp. ITFR-16]|uniref:hypothetical protein n=1 Tax=Streptomyces sp. ITFR-16 TaxID=3075198 RepID=UPI00288A9EE1|nr:hypothetical protein [Streptomyces sp. ITFR-16]WNI23644.1 hypothetical protein RLT58_17725 [Streptomyces sp. ITFR-16]